METGEAGRLFPVCSQDSPRDWLPGAPSLEGTLGIRTQKTRLVVALKPGRPEIVLKRKEKVQVKMGKGRVWKFHKAVHHDFEVFVPRKRPTPVPRQTYFLSFFRTTIVSPCPQHAGLTETKADATETKPQNLRSQTGLRGQHSTALNRF